MLGAMGNKGLHVGTRYMCLLSHLLFLSLLSPTFSLSQVLLPHGIKSHTWGLTFPDLQCRPQWLLGVRLIRAAGGKTRPEVTHHGYLCHPETPVRVLTWVFFQMSTRLYSAVCTPLWSIIALWKVRTVNSKSGTVRVRGWEALAGACLTPRVAKQLLLSWKFLALCCYRCWPVLASSPALGCGTADLTQRGDT